MADTVFTKIINGELPARKVYEDDTVLAFLDIHPASEGHTLVIPKHPYETFDDMDDETTAHLFIVAKQLANKYKKVFKTDRVALVALGLDIPHTHVQLIPLHSGKEVQLNNDQTAEPDFKALDETLAKINTTQ